MVINGTVSSNVLAALLIDADNFHDADQLRAIHSQFGQIAGKGFTCHVHGDPKHLFREDLRSIWQELGARLLPFLPLNKNTTDAGLIVDALMLHFKQGARRFGIASGDADFAPLALQLRELGCEVTCFARKSIAFEAMVSYYDRVVRFDVLPEPVSPALAPLPIVESRPQRVEVANLVTAQQKSVLVPSGAAVDSAPKPKAAAPATLQPSADETATAKKILGALPPWRPHTVKQLNQLGAPLRDAGVKTGNAPLHQLFRKCPAYFTVLPLTGAPKKVRLERRSEP